MKHPIAAALAALALCGGSAHADGTDVQLDHLAIYVTDQDASVAFYTGAFGFDEIDAPVNGPRWFDLGNHLALHIIPGRTVPLVPEKSVHMAFNVESLDPVIGYLDTHGIAFSSWPGEEGKITTRPDGVHQIYVQDPDGYWIELNDALAARD